MGFLNNKNISYEINYLRYRFKPHKLLLILFALLGSLIVSLGDAQAFFTGQNSPIPQNWTFLKRPLNSRLLAIFSIVIPSALLWYSEKAKAKEEIDVITKIIERVSLPFFEEDLNTLHRKIINKFAMTNDTRVYILMPIRKKMFHWCL